MKNKTSALRVLSITSLLAFTVDASALTINPIFIDQGQDFGRFGFGLAGSAPSNLAGAGTLLSVFGAAASVWESAILDTHTLDIRFGWTSLGGAYAIGTTSDGPPVGSGIIRFDNSNSTSWFADPTPSDASEYQNYRSYEADLGGGLVNVSRFYWGSTGDADGRVDLFTLALHEIGHFIGLVGTSLDPLIISNPLPHAGTSIQTIRSFGAHIDESQHFEALMGQSIDGGTRLLPTGIDILAVAQRSGFDTVNLNPTITPSIPEPETTVLFGVGLSLLVGVKRIRCRVG